uniref:Uncharacterized protein n=1 Tax=Anguilla anguilla TaxID=7936 RepID=A0A0E9R1E9_ANGAN
MSSSGSCFMHSAIALVLAMSQPNASATCCAIGRGSVWMSASIIAVPLSAIAR